MRTLDELLDACAALHHHLCPRQVLGVRIGLAVEPALGLELPRPDKRLLAIVETDGCAVDGITVVTGCRVGRRTLRVEDYGKVAATFIDTVTGKAVRIAPRVTARARAGDFAPEARTRWQAQLLGYQHMPNEELLDVQAVRLKRPLAALIGRPGRRVQCAVCGEEIINDRECLQGDRMLCRACAGQAYYEPSESDQDAATGASRPLGTGATDA